MEACKFGKPELSPEAALLGHERRTETTVLLSTEVATSHAVLQFPLIQTSIMHVINTQRHISHATHLP